ncbi:MAG: glycosyltransferase family 2 protein [Patescibacteria group bacterium]
MSNTQKKVAAIVAAYNEGPRIESVLHSLVACSDISEIVVVDDGSREMLDWIHERFPNVTLIRHEHNKGKAAAMETGVQATDAEYLFFCDADLDGFLPEHASAMIRPVVSGEYRMFIGIRENPEQQAVLLFALNSGERCVLRGDWDALPVFYKKGFRIETGLNVFVKKRGGKLGYKVFSYRQTIKEQKYGFLEGTKERVKLMYQVGVAYFYIAFIDYWRR